MINAFKNMVCVKKSIESVKKRTHHINNKRRLEWCVRWKRKPRPIYLRTIARHWDSRILKYWARFTIYQSNSCQIQSWPSFYDKQASCKISSKSIKNFILITDKQQNRKTDHYKTFFNVIDLIRWLWKTLLSIPKI